MAGKVGWQEDQCQAESFGKIFIGTTDIVIPDGQTSQTFSKGFYISHVHAIPNK